MRAYLFGWNPVKYAWENIEEDIIKTYSHDGFTDDWSVVSHKTIQPGDRAYFVRLGKEPKGLFASGFIAAEPYRAVYKRRHYYRINITFDVLLNPACQPILSMDHLKTGRLADQLWSPQASGISIRPHLVDELENLWLNFLNDNNLVERI